MIEMASNVSSEPFQVLAASLRESGFTANGGRLQNVLDGTWTTSSELIGELGTAVLAIRRECRTLNADQKALIGQCLREVRKVFPGFGWLRWPFFR